MGNKLTALLLFSMCGLRKVNHGKNAGRDTQSRPGAWSQSVLEVRAGDLANRIEEPYLDLCGSCVDRFPDWLRSGQRNGQHDVGTIVATPAVESTVMAGA